MSAFHVAATALGASGRASAAVSWHVLLTGFQLDWPSWIGDGAEALLLGAYLAGVARLARRGRRWPAWNTAAYALGVVSIFVAVGSGLAAYDDTNVVLHVVQHTLLMMVAPPLIALGRPVTLAAQALSRPNQLRVLRIVHSNAVATLTHPILVWILYYGTMYVYFETAAYRYSIDHAWFHYGTHVWFFLAGYLYWHPLVGLDPARWRWSYPVRMGSLFLGMPFEAFLGIGIASSSRPIATIDSLADTHSGGDTFWILSMLVTGLWLAVIVGQWFSTRERENRREDQRVELSIEENRTRAEALGVTDLPPGFTVPPWRLAELEARQARQVRAPRPS